MRGLVRLRSFTEDPEAITEYNPLTDENGKRSFTVTLKSEAKDHFVAVVKGVESREAADALRGVKLYVPRAALPDPGKREYYQADLVGLAVKDRKGKSYGTVLAVHDYGGGPFLEIGKSKGGSFMLPFTDVCVPRVDVTADTVTIEPKGWL